MSGLINNGKILNWIIGTRVIQTNISLRNLIINRLHKSDLSSQSMVRALYTGKKPEIGNRIG